MQHIKGLLLVIAGVAVIASGCTGAYTTPSNPDPLMETEHVVLKGFRNAVSLSAVKAKKDRLSTGRLRVRLKLFREALKSDFVEIMTVFLDGSGFELEKTNWEPMYLEKGIVTQYEIVSLSADAVDFRTVVRVPPGN